MQDLEPLIEEIGSLHRAVAKLEMSGNKQVTSDVYVENLDEVKKHLRDELEKFGRSLKGIIEGSKLPSFNISETIKLSNIGELDKSLGALRKVADQLDSKIGTINFKPNLNVTATTPPVTMPEIKLPTINVPKIEAPNVTVNPIVDIDLDAVISALAPLRLLSRDAKSPLAVRLSDGKQFIEQLTQAISEGNERLATVVSTSYGLTKDEYKAAVGELSYNLTGGSGVKALTDGTAVLLSASSVACKKVHITVTNGPVAVGFSSDVLATSGSEYGVMVYPANTPYIVETSNLNLIYVAGANGRRVCYNYFA